MTMNRIGRYNGIRLAVMTLTVLTILAQDYVEASPAPSIVGYDVLGVCIRNCAQCKKMYGQWFEGQLCAEACLKFNGKIIPDCEDVGSIAPFIGRLK